MPYKDPAAQQKYARAWHARRRAAFFADKACVDCGSLEHLELDHLDPSQKVHHNVWSWSAERRNAEVAECAVRCADCHRDRHSALRIRHGIKRYEKGCRCDVCRAAKAESNRRYRMNEEIRMSELVIVTHIKRNGTVRDSEESEGLVVDADKAGNVRLTLDSGDELVAKRADLLEALGVDAEAA